MIVRGVGRAIAGLALVAAVSACDDNPLAENREDAEYFYLSVSNAVVEAGGTIGVRANVLNQYGAALDVNVTGAECNANISVAPDPIRSDYEAPELFIITGNTVGESCVVVSGGGVTDTINVRIVPAEVDLELAAPADTLLESGDVVNLPIVYLGATGAAAPGAALDDRTSFTVVTSAVGSIDDQGNFTARAPGTTWVRATYSHLGVSRSDSVQISVIPAVFAGTATQIAFAGGQAVQFSAGALPFDDNTRVEFPDMSAGTFVHALPNSETVRAMIPPGTAAGEEIRFFILNVGPTDATVEGTFTTTALATAPPSLNTSSATATALAVGEDGFGMIAGVRGAEQWFTVDVTEAGTYEVEFTWDDNLDKDVYVLDSTGATLAALENAASSNPEHTELDLEPGTYYLIGSTWTPTAGAAAFYRMRFIRVD